MADIVTNTLQIGNDNLILRDADAQEQITGLKEDLSESVDDLKNALDASGVLYDIPILTGKYYGGSVGNQYTLSTNANSIYIEPVDVSSLKGSKIKVLLSAFDSSSRRTGFCDSNGVISSFWTAGDTSKWVQRSDGWYEGDFVITDDYFFFSYYYNREVIICISEVQKIGLLENAIDDLQDSVLELKIESTAEIKALNTGRSEIERPLKYYQGYVHGLNYDNPSSSNTITIYSQLNENIGRVKLVVTNGYKAIVVNGNTDKQMLTYSSWFTGTAEYTPDSVYWCIEIRKIDESIISPEDSSNVVVSQIVETAILGTNVVYVSPSGSDLNTGISRSFPFRTIQKAIDFGGKEILVKEGSYSSFALEDKNNVHISIDPYYSSFVAVTSEDLPKIVIDSNNNESISVLIKNCNDCELQNIEVKKANVSGIKVQRSTGIVFTDCIAHDIATTAPANGNAGFEIVYSDCIFNNCIAYNIGISTTPTEPTYHVDGFNMHGTGNTIFNDCSAWNCMDDGISHHDSCTGTINGGEWYHCGKGGVASPTHGAKINIYGVYSHDNLYGLYAGNEAAVTDRGNIIVANSVFLNNSEKDMYVNSYYHGYALNCLRETIDATNFTFIGGSIMP